MSSKVWKILCALLPVAGTLLASSWTGWHPRAWATLRGSNETVEVFAPAHLHVVTNWLDGAARITTNVYVSPIYFQSNLTAVVLSATYPVITAGGTTTLLTLTTTNRATPTNTVLAHREIVGFDVFEAMRERDCALGRGAAWVEADSYFPRVYRRERDQLVAGKAWVRANCGSFVNTNTPPPFANWTVTGLLARCNLPTNYLDQTPWSALWCGDTGATMVATSRIMVVGTTNVTTNVLVNSCGQTFTNIGVMGTGTLLTVVCTNDLPFQGTNLNASAWGWCAISNLFNALTVTKVQGNDEEAFVGTMSSTIQTNVAAWSTGMYCNVETLESNYVFYAAAAPPPWAPWPMDHFPLYEHRNIEAVSQTNVTYQYRVDWWFAEDAMPCDTELTYDKYTSEEHCSPLTVLSNEIINCVMGNLAGDHMVFLWTLTNTVSGQCNPSNVCRALPNMDIASHVAPITFVSPTSYYPAAIGWTADVWISSSSHTGYSFVNPFSEVTLHPDGWTNNVGLGTNGFRTDGTPVWVVTNFQTARIPWAGESTPMAKSWEIRDAVLLKRWNFRYR